MKDRTRHTRVAAYKSMCKLQVEQTNLDPEAKAYWLKCLLRGAKTYVEIHSEVGLVMPSHPPWGTKMWYLHEPPDRKKVTMFLRQLDRDVGIRDLNLEPQWREQQGVVTTRE
jgi:hypothetical protein